MRFKEFLFEYATPSVKTGLRFGMSVPANAPIRATEELNATLADSLSKVVGAPVKVAKKRPSVRGRDWTIVAANPEDGELHKIEIVSPPLPSAIAQKKISAVADWITLNGLRTDDGDGMHAILSASGLQSKFDPIKLVLHLNDPSVHSIFSKAISSYSPAHVDVLTHKIKQSGKLTKSAAPELYDAALKYLGQRDDGSTEIDPHALDFLVIGGAGYEHNLDAARKKIYKLTSSTDAALDSSFMKSDYVKSLADLFAGKRPTSRSAEEMELPKEIKVFAELDPEIGDAWELYAADAAFGRGSAALLVLISRIMGAALKRKAALTSSEKAFIKSLLKTAAVDSTEADRFFGNDRFSRMKFKRDFAV